MLEVRPFSVELVHERDRWGLVFLGRAPNRFWFVMVTGGRVENVCGVVVV